MLNKKKDVKMKSMNLMWLKIGIPVFILLIFLYSILVKVTGQEVAVVVTPSGVDQEVLEPGWHLVSPFNSVFKMDKTTQVYTFSSKKIDGQITGDDAIWTPTSDGIKIGLDMSVTWQIDPSKAWWIYANVSEQDGKDRYDWIEENVIRPKTKSACALTTSRFSPIQVYSGDRQKIQDQIYSRLQAELKKYNIVLNQVDLREVYYNPEYEKAINAKKLEEQEVLRLEQVTKQKQEQIKQSELDKNMAILKAEGEAKALSIKANAINQNPKIVDLEWIAKWDGKLPTYMMGNGTTMMIKGF